MPKCDGTERERARCLAIAIECLEHGHQAPASKEFADGYSVACQEIAGEISRGDEPVRIERQRGLRSGCWSHQSASPPSSHSVQSSSASIVRTITLSDLQAAAVASGRSNTSAARRQIR